MRDNSFPTKSVICGVEVMVGKLPERSRFRGDVSLTQGPAANIAKVLAKGHLPVSAGPHGWAIPECSVLLVLEIPDAFTEDRALRAGGQKKPTLATHHSYVVLLQCFLALVLRNVLVFTNLPPP